MYMQNRSQSRLQKADAMARCARWGSFQTGSKRFGRLSRSSGGLKGCGVGRGRGLGGPKGLQVCYEAGPTGYALYWQLTKLGVECEVIAPSLIPTKAGDRVKTDRRDAIKLARCYRAGELTPVWVPDRDHEALRDLVRAREAAKKDQLRARHRLGKFLLRHGRRPQGLKAWTKQYLTWIKTHVRFD